MILCAGLGTRLRPVTKVWPKPAVPLLGQPLLRHSVRAVRKAGVTELSFNTFHLPDAFSPLLHYFEQGFDHRMGAMAAGMQFVFDICEDEFLRWHLHEG